MLQPNLPNLSNILTESTVYVVLKVEKVTHTSDATLHVNGGEIHASAEGQDMYAAIDGLIDKLARQLTKHKDKLKQH